MTIKFQTSINVKSVCYLFQKSPSFNATCGITSEMTSHIDATSAPKPLMLSST